jgi:hypothetical protein
VTRTRTAITALSCLSVLALGACSDDDPEPKFAPTPSTSAPTSPSTTAASGPAEPTMPAAAGQRSDAGAEAFVRYFIEVLNFAQRTGNTGTLDQISTPNCSACAGYITAIDTAYGGGGRVEGGQIQVGRLRELPKDYGADWGAYGQGRATPQVIFSGDGSKKSYVGGQFPLYVYPKWDGRGWAMQWMRTPA